MKIKNLIIHLSNMAQTVRNIGATDGSDQMILDFVQKSNKTMLGGCFVTINTAVRTRSARTCSGPSRVIFFVLTHLSSFSINETRRKN